MTLEQLRIFVAVAECQHVTGAARTLRLTQSAVSAAVRALEDRHAVSLFDRVGRGVVLTAAGRLFLVEARAVLAAAAAAEAALDEMAGLKRGTLHVAASQTVAHYWLPAQLAAYGARYPGIRLSVRIGNSVQVREWLADGVIDLGFVEDDVSTSGFVSHVVATDALVAVAPPALMYASADVSKLAWVLREKGSGTRSIFEDRLAALGISPSGLNVVLELPSNEAVCAAAIAGIGATALSQRVVADALASGALLRLAVDLPQRHFYLVRNRTRGISPPMAALQKIVLGNAGERAIVA